MKWLKISCSLSLIALILVGCQGENDLTQFISTVNSRVPSQIEPAPAIQNFEHYAYSSAVLRSPFQPPLSLSGKLNAGKGPDAGRPKELLETYPLDSLKFVGAIQKKARVWALIMDKNRMVHRLTVGHYIGQNNGKIHNIFEDKIELIEMIADSQGRWQERPTTIKLLD